MIVKVFLLLFVFLSVVFTQDAKANEKDSGNEVVHEEEEEEVEEEEKVQPVFWRFPHPDVETSSVFPLYPDGKMPLGKYIEIILGFSNKGNAAKTFNVTYIYGSLRYAQAPNVILQNFSYMQPGDIIRPGRSVSFPWWFYPDSLLEPREYFLQAQIEYTDEDNHNYSMVFYNSTIELVDESEFDLSSLFTFFLIFALGAVGFFFFSNSSPQGIVGTLTNTAPEVKKVSAVGQGNLDSWTSNAVMDNWKKNKGKGGKK